MTRSGCAPRRRLDVLTVLVLVALVVSACGTSPHGPSGAPGNGASLAASTMPDGELDCSDGQLVRGAIIRVTGQTEAEVVAHALAQWTELGADTVQGGDESWSAVLDGAEVAVAVPERDGTGDWVVHDVTTCGLPETGPARIDGEVDCASDIRWVVAGNVSADVVGEPTAEKAVRSTLTPYQEQHGGDVVMVEETRGSLVIELREQVVTHANQVASGGWVVTTIVGCQGTERERGVSDGGGA